MSWHQRWRNVFRSERLNTELDDEFQYHLAETSDRLMAAGLPENEARQAARRRLGNYSMQKESTRDMNIAAWLDATRADLLYGLRQLKLNPGFASIAVLSLALGIGANAAIFQLVDAIRLKTLPVQNPQELVSIDFENGSTRAGSWWGRMAAVTYGQWDQIRTQQQAFSGVVAWSAEKFNLSIGGEPRYAEGLYVSGEFFRHLGVDAILGRTLSAQDDTTTCSAGAVISYPFWQREFGGDLKILARKLTLNGYSLPVIGVTPPSFFGLEVGSRYDVAIPLCADRLLAEDKRGRIPVVAGYWLTIMGRLKPGWTPQRAAAHLRALSPSIMRATLPSTYRPDMAKGYLANKLTVKEAGTGVSPLRRQYERPLWLLLSTTGLVLLISCANLANLLLARAAAREPEIAMRLAIGASRARLVRQLLAESLLLATGGAALGMVLAVVLSRALVLLMSAPDNPLFVDLALDWRMLVFTATIAVLTCLLFGLMPALRSAFLSPVTAMRAGVRSVTAGRERFSFRRALVATQIALSLVLLFGALLFVRSLHNLLTADAGFRPEGILTVDIDFSKLPYPEKARLQMYSELFNRLSSIPGVVSVAQNSMTPLSGNNWDNLVAVDGAAAARGKDCFFSQPGPGYFRTMGIPLLAGRDFTARDTPASTKVAIVNEMFARTFFAGANPVGHTLRMSADAGQPEPEFQIVGLVRNTKYHELKEEFQPIAFFPIAQAARLDATPTFVVRIAGAPGPFMKAATSTIGAINPSIGIEFRTFLVQLQNSLLRERLMATLSGGFGFLAGLLATLGLYGVVSYMVAQRRNEIGVRVAVGATRGNVIRLILREAVLLLVVGLAAGAFLAVWAGRAAATLLFGLEAHDVVSLVAASALLTAVAILSSYLPARRAAALDPMAVLRSE